MTEAPEVQPPEVAVAPWLELATAVFTGIAAVAAIWAVVIAVRALAVSRETAAVDQLFASFSELIACLQEIGRLGEKLGGMRDGERRSRAVIDGPFQRFLAARSRVDLATEALGLRGPYTESVLNLAHTFAVGVLQADEFGDITRVMIRDDDRSWVTELSWRPTPREEEVLARSLSFLEVRQAKELIDPDAVRLAGLDEWWGKRIADPDYQSGRSVYSIKATYLTQNARLLDDFTREYVQPMCEEALRAVARSTKRMAKPLA